MKMCCAKRPLWIPVAGPGARAPHTVTGRLRLKAAAGALSEHDLDEVNRAATP